MRSRRARILLRIAGALAVLLLVAVAIVRVAVGWVYPIKSNSMVPTLAPGEWVFLRWDKTPPRPFEPVVFRTSTGEAVVKRTWAPADSRVVINPAGDVLVDDRPPVGQGRPGPIAVYDQRVNGYAGFWMEEGTVSEVEGGAIELDGRGAAASVRFHKGVHDDRLEDDGTISYGDAPMHDIGLRAALFPRSDGGVVRLTVTDRTESFELELDLPQTSGKVRASFWRHARGSSARLMESSVEIPLGAWFEVTFRNIDDRLTASVGGVALTPHSYVSAVHEFDSSENVVAGTVSISVDEGTRVEVRDLVVDRDLFVPPAGAYAVDRPLDLRQNEFFVLGDNPEHSRDSREMGPIPFARLVGRPTLVVWPPSRWRWLAR